MEYYNFYIALLKAPLKRIVLEDRHCGVIYKGHYSDFTSYTFQSLWKEQVAVREDKYDYHIYFLNHTKDEILSKLKG